MLKKYKGILLFKKIHKDNDLFIKFLSETDELINGIVYGGLSNKKRNIFQIGFYLNIEVKYINNKPASISGELSEPFISSILNNKYKINCLMSITSLINISIIEGQKVKDIFKISNDFLSKMIVKKKWLREYFIFLFNLLKIIGYEIDYLNNKNKYFDLIDLQFMDYNSNNSIIFPHNFFANNQTKIDIVIVYQLFEIFEKVYIQNHLSNFNLNLPNQYHLFKRLIIQKLKQQ